MSGDSEVEAELVRQIAEQFPASVASRYEELIGKRQARILSPEDHEELLRLTDQAELREARRAQALVELARLRQQPLGAVLSDLGIVPGEIS